jgi:hypothetical protein
MPARKTKREELVARSTFVTEVDGREVHVHGGDVVLSDSPLVEGREVLFVSRSEYVEQKGKPRGA